MERKHTKTAEKLTTTERRLLLFGIFTHCEVTEIQEITTRLPIGIRMIQRDIQELEEAGLLSVTFSREENGYIKRGQPVFNDRAEGKHRENLLRLNRLGRLMSELYDEEIPSWDKDESESHETTKTVYQKLFPNLSERTRQRDFKTLSNIGYKITYDNWERCYKLDFCAQGLRDSFGVYRIGNKLFRE